MERLRTSIQALLDAPAEQSIATDAATEAQTAAPMAQRLGFPSSSSEKRDVPAKVPQKQEASMAGKAPGTPVNRGRKSVSAAAIVALLTVGFLSAWWFAFEQPRRNAERERQLTEQKEKDQRDNEATRQREIAEQERLVGERKARTETDAEKERLATQPRAKEEETKKKADSPKSVAAVSREQPYVNSLGMKFVPVPGTGALFSVWETRVKDFEAFVKASAYKAEGRMVSLEEKKGLVRVGRTWKDPGFSQTREHAACGISWEDATAFCGWLTEQERKAGLISPTQSYRLPSDEEWSAAVGLEKENGSTPESKDMKVKAIYPWGTKFPPPAGGGNYAGSEARTGGWKSVWKGIDGYRDEYARTSPVGSFEGNGYGIHDLGGNVWEWCEDWWDGEKKYRVLRGASWIDYVPDTMLSSCRKYWAPELRFVFNGFRCVLVMESSR